MSSRRRRPARTSASTWRALRRRRPGRHRRRDPARAAAGRRPRDGGGARRDADRARRQGPRRRRAPALRARSSTRARCATSSRHPARGAAGLRAGRREAVYLMRPGYAVRLPTPPPFHNKGNWIFSLAQLGRHLAEQAEELGAMVLPETAAQTLLVEDGAVRGIVTGDKGLDREGGPTAAYEPGDRDPGPRDGAVRGDAGAPRGRSGRGVQPAHREPAGLEPRRQGGVEGRAPARPGDPHARMAAALGGEARRVRRQLHLPDGRRPADDRARRRARAPRRLALGARPAPAVQDPPDDPRAARGRRARGLGGEDDPRGRAPRPSRTASRCRARSSRATRRAS